MPYTFLSDEWLDAAEKIRAEAGDAAKPPAGMADLKLNITVTGGPEGDKDIHMAGGDFGKGHVDDAPTKLTVPFDVAKAIFIEGNQQAGMTAFMQGQIKVEGDMSRLMAMQGAGMSASPEQQAMQQKLKEITE